ncbi:MAG: NusG domain II-containing protein [Firmicutes bacterium]|nr:NusG domain II-containing protein [Bacillota bacterium]
MTRGDKVVLGAVVVLALAVFGYQGMRFRLMPPAQEAQVVVEVKGEVVETHPLKDLKAGGQWQVKGPLGYSVYEGGDNRVRMVSSPCPDKVCVKRGWISASGEAIICVPNQVVIHVEGHQEDEEGPDALTQ